MDKKAEKIIKEYETLKGARQNWTEHWEECAQYALPRKEDDIYGFDVKGNKRGNILVFDSTAPNCVDELASALHGELTNPSLKWFEMITGDPRIDVDKEARSWLQHVADVMNLTFENSNFHSEIHEYYIDEIVFGTGVLLIEEDDRDICRFSAKPIFNVFVRENYRGEIDTFYRECEYDYKQIVEEFGEDSLTKDMKMEMERDQLKKWCVIHYIAPRKDSDDKVKNAKDFTFDSVYILKEKKHILEDDGYKEQPIVACRWSKTTRETLGRSPTMKALPDTKMINKMMRVTLRSAEKSMDPPLLFPDDGIVLPININPGGISYYRSGTKDKVEPLFTGSRIDFGFEVIRNIQDSIKKAYFLDQLKLNDGPQKTATEVRQRARDNRRIFGPLLARQQNEGLKKIIDRVFGIHLRKGKFRTPPKILQGMNLSVRYSSQIAMAQKTSDTDNLVLALNAAAPIIQTSPTSLQVFNPDMTVKYYANKFGVPESIMRSDRELAELRQREEEARQQAISEQQKMNDADVLSKIEGA